MDAGHEAEPAAARAHGVGAGVVDPVMGGAGAHVRAVARPAEAGIGPGAPARRRRRGRAPAHLAAPGSGTRYEVGVPGFFETRVLPPLVDWSMRGRELEAVRARVVPRARGRVLELGFGTGLNARHYGEIDELVVVEPNPGMKALAERRLAAAGRPGRVELAAGEALPFTDASFDAVVCTFTLCSVEDPARVVRELWRVLRPGGELLFAEHGLSDRPGVQAWQRRITPLWSYFSGGCRLDVDVCSLLRDARFELDELRSNPMPSGVALVGLLREGVARRA